MRPDIDPNLIAFRPLAEGDLRIMHEWLNRDHVAEWYGVGGVRRPTPGQVEARYGPRIRGEEPTRSFLASYGGRPVGYIQTYLVDDYAENARDIELEPSTAGIDLFIGEPELVGRGLGAALLRKFLREIIFAERRVAACVICPSPDNARAIRCYEKAGFRYLKTVAVPGGDPPVEYLMIVRQEEAPGR